jgi:hypothetical protein
MYLVTPICHQYCHTQSNTEGIIAMPAYFDTLHGPVRGRILPEELIAFDIARILSRNTPYLLHISGYYQSEIINNNADKSPQYWL